MYQDDKKNIRNYPVSTWLGLAAVFLMVSALGTFSYIKLNGILNELSGAALPDSRLLAVKGLQTTIQEAENSLRTYSLTRDTNDLNRFSDIAGSINGEMDAFLDQELDRDENDSMLYLLDSLVAEKFNVQNSILALMRSDMNASLIDQFSKSLRRVSRSTAPKEDSPVVAIPTPQADTNTNLPIPSGTVEEPDAYEKRGFIRRLFSRKKKVEPEKKIVLTPIIPSIVPADSDTAPVVVAPPVEKPADPAILKELNAELKQIKALENARYNAMTAEELQFTRAEQRITRQIEKIVAQIERAERTSVALRTLKAASLAREANWLILVVCVTLGILLILLAYGLFSYFRTSSRYQKGIEEAKIEAENLARARESFLSTMSHEIRTPLNAIIGFSERVSQSKLEAEQAKQLGYVKDSARHLLEIVNDVLDFSKLEAGAMTFANTPFDLRETLEWCLSAVRIPASEKSIRLEIEVDDRLPFLLSGDAKRLRQVLLNLLNNAVRFTDEGEIVLRAMQKAKRRDGILVAFEVADTGIGIAEEQQSSVFGEFTQVGLEEGRNRGGTGLGLPISKRIIEAQGGKISLKSKAGEGTQIEFQIRFKKTGVAIDTSARMPTTEVRSVLVVDDTEYNRLLLWEVLQARGLEITLANNGAEALKEMEKNRFDLVMLDIRMPVMNGIEVLRAIRSGKSGAPKTQRVIALTAAETKEDRRACMEAGCEAILSKPLNEDELWRLVGMPVEIPPKIKPPKAEEKSPYSLHHLRSMAPDNDQFVTEMVASYLEMAERSRKLMASHLRNGELSKMKEVLHKLAPATRHLEAIKVYELIKEMESLIDDARGREEIVPLHQALEKEFDKVVPLLRGELVKMENPARQDHQAKT